MNSTNELPSGCCGLAQGLLSPLKLSLKSQGKVYRSIFPVFLYACKNSL